MAEPQPDFLHKIIQRIDLRTGKDAVQARQVVARELKARGVSALRVTRFATAVSEIARNVIVHGGGGHFTVGLNAATSYLDVECRDRGRGIPDIEQAMKDGFTTAGGLGRGLGGAKRLSDRFEIETVPGQGTTVRMSAKI
ncbi:ATP-binding protein [Roseicyclus sp. F158]|uniref:ATP-binding protein n=1 Tax=Tropicimonas omnivorans TaxID=3075590 RepID=A0ABU3DKX0_9RHOB|nr:ATP-binding protein [Roseicyclus sp. F158]MDT0684361.1 ATP-binding protein [Roseicyclus sp. F158]